MYVDVSGIKVFADNAITQEEIDKIVADEKAIWRKQKREISQIAIDREGDDLVIKTSERSPIKRVRRITGYLSTVDKFNDSKQAELRDRVKHDKHTNILLDRSE